MAVVAFWVPIALIVMSVFAMISVAAWADARRREREALYRSELFGKLAAQPPETVDRIIQFLRDEQERKDARQQGEKRYGLQLGGAIGLVVGVVLSSFLAMIVPNGPMWLIGMFPVGVGVVLLAFSYVRRPD